MKLQIECLVTESMRDLFNRVYTRLVSQPQAGLPGPAATLPTDFNTLTVLMLEYFISRNFSVSRSTDGTSFKADADDWKIFVPENNGDVMFYIKLKDQIFDVSARIMKRSNVVDIILIVSYQLSRNEYVRLMNVIGEKFEQVKSFNNFFPFYCSA